MGDFSLSCRPAILVVSNENNKNGVSAAIFAADLLRIRNFLLLKILTKIVQFDVTLYSAPTTSKLDGLIRALY